MTEAAEREEGRCQRHADNSPKNAPETLINEGAAAEILDAKPSTLRAWRARGVGPEYIKVGRLIKYRPSKIHAYQLAQAVDPEAA